MRSAVIATLALTVATVATVAGSSPAAAYDYPYCLQGRTIGIPGDCSYSSYGQCMASASGRGLYCNVNPRFAFGQQQRRMRVYRDY
ncbi:DUF3551 domain-containing protein [Bradyrhizobium sp. sGM-13]|uniref:DUF3551 domain-containing protein n=1 Tax=Bradyrhizobium sp. sGM-13 TaxID=2831781 RepID=UPI001BCE6F5D|nr:DUF3551 domain-containing protein [Bradyrhizobium sp. sGM-13]